MTRNDLEQAVYRRTNKNTSSVDTATQTRIRHFLNQRHRRLLAMPGLHFLRETVLSFASVASQSRYALPHVAAVTRMWETTNDRDLDPLSKDEYRLINPNPDNFAGTPTHWVFLGYEPVSVQPANASSLFLKSTSASDTQTAYVETEITGGYPRVQSVALTGVTAVDLGATITTNERVTKFYLASAAAGVVTLHEDSGSGTELARIGIGQTTQKYWVFHLHPQPSAVVTYFADAELVVADFAQDTDEPWVPEDFHCLLELGATMDEMIKMDDSRYAAVATEYADEMEKLEYWIAKQAAGRETPRGWSRLGPQFEAGT